MKRFGLLVFVLLLSLVFFGVNSPKQPVLFFRVENSLSNLPANIAELLKLGLYENIDAENNMPNFESRNSYELYPDEEVYAVEIAVVAARILGLEKEILEKYPLSSPTFNDIKSKLENLYVQNGYDFSRNFGYIEYINDYFVKKINKPLLENSDPLMKVKKIDAIKAIVKIFTVFSLENNLGFYTKEGNFVEYAEKLNSRLDKEIYSSKDAGYIKVFERYFLTKFEDKIIPVIKLPYFEGDNNLEGNETINRAYFYSLIAYIFGNTPEKINDEKMIPVRTLNNMITYLPKSMFNEEPVLFEIKKPQIEKINKIVPHKFSNDVVVFNTNNENLIALDNSKITVKTNYNVENIVENTTSSKKLIRQKEEYYNGKEFSMMYKYLDKKDNNEKKYEFLSSGTIKKDNNEVWIVDVNHEIIDKDVEIPSNLDLSDKFKISGNEIKARWYSVDVETIDEMKKLAEKGFSGIPEKYKVLHKEVNAEDIPDNIGVAFKTEVNYKYRSKVIQSDFYNSIVKYYKVRDRLNVSREYATKESLEKFLNMYVNTENIDESENKDFLNYWNDINKKLEDLNVDKKAYFIPEMEINMDIVEEKFIQKPQDMTIFFWTFYGGKLVSFEPATYRLFTQKFVDPFKFSPNALLYVKYKDGTVKNGTMRKNGKELLYNDSGEYLRDMLLWFQVALKFDKYGNNYLEIIYVIAEEI